MSSLGSSYSSIQKSYIGYPMEYQWRCLLCHSPVHRRYVTSKHKFLDFKGIIQEIRGLYLCDNFMCPLSFHPFNPSPISVLPYKRYSMDVWRWIAQEYKIFHQNADQIVIRIQAVFQVKFSTEQIQRIMDEIDVMIGCAIDERTKKLLNDQKIILLGLDGQKPDGDGNVLWIFVDMISNRVLKVVVLKNADADTLHEIVDKILTEFQVELIGIVSDKQNNIENMHDTYYSNIPHQYCQFHFLQNLWNHLEVKDSHLHKTIEKEINRLEIVSLSPVVQSTFEEIGKVPVRMLFAPIETDLRRILRTHTTKFTNFRGIETYSLLESYIPHLVDLLEKGNDDSRLVSMLNRAIQTLKTLLLQEKPCYSDCLDLFHRFQEIQSLLSQDTEEREHISAVDLYFAKLWDELKRDSTCPPKKALRTFLPQMDTSHDEILREWVRLYDSYHRGLFSYFRFPVPVKTTSILESSFSQEKGEFRRRSGKSHVGYMIRTRGEFELKRIYVGKDEIQEHVNNLSDNLDPFEIKQGLIELSLRKAEETMGWAGSEMKLDGWNAMEHILSLNPIKAKNGRKKKMK